MNPLVKIENALSEIHRVLNSADCFRVDFDDDQINENILQFVLDEHVSKIHCSLDTCSSAIRLYRKAKNAAL